MKGGLRTGRFPEACSRQSAEIPPRGVARRKTRVLRRGGAAWPAGPLSHGSSVSSRRLAGAEPPPLLASVRSQPWTGLRVCGPSCSTAAGSRAAPAGREPRLGEAGAELRAGLQAAGGPRKNSLRLPAPGPPVQSPAPPERPGALHPGAGPPKPRALGVRGAVWALGPRESRREGVWVLPELVYSGPQRKRALAWAVGR